MQTQSVPSRTERMATPFGQVDVTFSVNGRGGLGAQFAGAQRLDSEHLDAVVDSILVNWPAVRQDATTSIAFARGLEYIFKEVYELEFPELRAPDFIPVSTEVPAGSLTFTYRMLGKTGAAQIIHNAADDLPIVGYEGKEFPRPVITIGCAYVITMVDVERAAMLEVPLESMLASACKWAIEYLTEQIACNGALNEGVCGITNAPGVAGATQISTGTWLHQIKLIAAATASAPATAVAATQGITADVNAMKQGIFTATNGLYEMDTLLLPVDLYSALQGVPRSPAFTNDNLVDYLEKVCNVTVDYWPQLNAASATTHGRVMGYKKDPQVLRFIQARPFTQFAPQARNLAWITPCIAEIGGTQVLRPLAVTYMDGLDDSS